MRRFTILSAALVVMAVGVATAQAAVVASPVKGKPDIKSIDVIEFADDGTLLIGDGKGGQVVAVVLGDQGKLTSPPAKVANVNALLAARMGAKPDGIELVDLAVHPKSGKVFLAVRKQDDKASAILTVDAAGKISEFALDDVSHASIILGGGKRAPIAKITDVAWVDDKLIAAAATSEEFASKIFVAKGPLVHNATGSLHAAETYHVSHHKWETKAPMSVIMPYRENGQTYVVGAFSCTPVVKYPIDSIQPDAQVKGTSMIELGSGNRPVDMFTYTKNGKEYVLTSTFRFHHQRKPLGPSPYWTVRFERSLLGETEKVDEKAVYRLTSTGEPATDRITFVDAYNGVMQMDRLGEDRAVVLRSRDGGAIDLEVLQLP